MDARRTRWNPEAVPVSSGPPEWLDDGEFELWRVRREEAIAHLTEQVKERGRTPKQKREAVEAMALWEADLRAWYVARDRRRA